MKDLFGGAAPFYAKYRADHGDPAIDHLARTFGPDAVVLDLGCGPGTVAIPLARRVRAVLAVDPDEEMLAEGRRLAADVPNIRWLRGDSTRLRELPPFGHVVMGRSFHWMDRRAVLADLDDLLPPGGVVALVGPGRGAVEEPWEPVMRRVRERFGADDSLTKAPGTFQATGEHPHDVLPGSPFPDLESVHDEQRLAYDLDAVLGLQLSYSFTAPARLGDRLPAFVAEARAALLAANPSGRWEMVRITEVLIARRSAR
ncbi:MAG: class I SAM-dependent methyltransferase [Nonomuraea sp.]|nr:class I SAM-dependent methyltransferase [Nonomuraea sp.]NUP61239.1 class I SAM-dependent methyltransferase [Nonomuraea sp.]NUP81495.1 class I SAM-dependent methyltransferase [Nonomuraea sp.]NUS05327.1 class I SAM-dependent methyltransferase [Nonomuraea sp.]NUT12102.1 class I SAM-dependent methyltransferase [Nonomuraea sp.]